MPGVGLKNLPVADGRPHGLHGHNARARVLLEGMSHQTRVLVGEVEVWTGVREDVDWRGVVATTAQQ